MITASKFDSERFYRRLTTFGQRAQKLVFVIPKKEHNLIYGKQLLRSSSSVGANYIEAIEALGKKDFIHRLRICRKEARESIHWLEFIKSSNKDLFEELIECDQLISEGNEVIKILTSSIITLEKKLLLR